MNKHVHCEVIKAYADGEKIQVFDPDRNQWNNTAHPSFLPDCKYRVKPKEVLLEGQPLEIGQKVYYKGSNPHEHISRIVKNFDSEFLWTTTLAGEELGYNYIECFTREEPLGEKLTDNHIPVMELEEDVVYWVIDPATTESVYSTNFYHVPNWAKNLAKRKMVFKTREGALARFKELFE